MTGREEKDAGTGSDGIPAMTDGRFLEDLIGTGQDGSHFFRFDKNRFIILKN